jgi:LacI family transcriptional regulator
VEKDKRVTIADVARSANVSRTLVSFVLNGRTDVSAATRTRILQAIEELGYRPNAVARNLAKRRAGAIGIICDMETYQDALGMQFLAAILTAAAERAQRVMLIPNDDRQIQEMAEDHAVDGMIFLDEQLADPCIARLQEIGFPAMGIWNTYLDNILRKGLEELALHLESRGHQRAICLCGPANKLFSTRFDHMTTMTLPEYGIATSTFYCPPQSETDMARALAREARGDRATVIVASSDKLAIDTIHSLHAARLRVPDDCAVTGFGDIPSAQWIQPPLTTLRIPVKTLADWTVTTLLKEEAEGKLTASHDMPGSRLVVRRSC